jgi:hypothetical protein
MKILLFLFSIAPLCAQIALEPPSFGCHADAYGRLRRLAGVRAGLVATLATTEAVSQGICNARSVLYQKGADVVLSTAEGSVALASAGPVILALDDRIAAAIDVTGGQIHYSTGGEWQISPCQIEQAVLAARLRNGKLVLRTTDAVKTIDIVSGVIEDSWNPSTGIGPTSVLSGESIITVVDQSWVHCTRAGCETLGPAPPGIRSLSPLNDDWFSATLATGLALAVRVGDGKIESFLLPGGVQQ